MSRLRYNGLSGTLGAEHNDSTTTLTLSSKLTYEGGDVPTIAAPDYLPLSILDSDGNCAEIVHVTAYTSAATTGTIARGREGTGAQTHSDGSSFVHGPTSYDFGFAPLEINPQTGTSYTFVLADASRLTTLTNASAITATVPPNSSVAFPTGTRIGLAQRGAGQVTVAPGSGVTVNTSETLKLADQYAYAELVKHDTDEWDLVGRLATFLSISDPTEISGCVLWLDASNSGSITETSGAVEAWDDLSGSGHSLVQATASNKPTTGTRTENSLNVLDFDGSDYLYDSSAAIPVDAVTVFLVGLSDVTTANKGMLVATPSTGNDWNESDGWVMETSHTGAYLELVGDGAGAAYSGTGATPFSVWHATISAASAKAIWRDGNPGATSSGSTSGDSTGVLVGARFSSGPDASAGLDGAIAEVIVYERVLTDTEANAVGQYLQAKWDTPAWTDL